MQMFAWWWLQTPFLLFTSVKTLLLSSWTWWCWWLFSWFISEDDGWWLRLSLRLLSGLFFTESFFSLPSEVMLQWRSFENVRNGLNIKWYSNLRAHKLSKRVWIVRWVSIFSCFDVEKANGALFDVFVKHVRLNDLTIHCRVKWQPNFQTHKWKVWCLPLEEKFGEWLDWSGAD